MTTVISLGILEKFVGDFMVILPEVVQVEEPGLMPIILLW
jgi:hypothetical protein